MPPDRPTSPPPSDIEDTDKDTVADVCEEFTPDDIIDDDCGKDLSSACPISLNDLNEKSFEQLCDIDFFQVTLEASRPYNIRTPSTASRPRIYNSTGELLATDGESLVHYVPEEAGVYYIEMRHDPDESIGEYSFRLIQDDCSHYSHCSLTVGVPPLDATVDAYGGRDDDVFRFTLNAGENYKIEINTPDRQVDIAILKSLPDEEMKAFFGVALSDTIFFSPPATAEYTLELIIYSRDSTSVPYSLSIDTVDSIGDDCAGDSASSCAISVGSEKVGLFESAGDKDWFSVTLEAGTYYQISAALGNYILPLLNDDKFSLAGKIYDNSGAEVEDFGFGDIANNPELRQGFVAPTDGVYYIELSHISGALMSYGLGVWEDDCSDLIGDSKNCVLEVDSPKEGKLGKRDLNDVYSLELLEAADYILNVENLSPSSRYVYYLIKFSPLRRDFLVGRGRTREEGRGEILESGANKEISFRSLGAGTYYFVIRPSIYVKEGDFWHTDPVEDRSYSITLSTSSP